ncbi:MAG: hypothetical protein EHM61_17455 [Acidobacteria bacterium]|nr:MAG: hypothetical protein EHM61_17455 [Acidobacteriota bacterium]
MSGPAVDIGSGSAAIVTFTAPSVTADASLVFRLTVIDGRGGSATDEVNVIVDVNSPPTVNAGPDRFVPSGSSVTLSGSGSDPDSDPITFFWSQIDGPSVNLAATDTPTLQFVAPTVSQDIYLAFRLRVSDSKSAQATDDVLVKVTKKKDKLVMPASLNGVDPMVDNSFIGVAVLNNSSQADTLQIAAVNSAGSEQLVKSSVFQPQAQDAFLADAVTPDSPDAVSLTAHADNSAVRGFFMIGRGQPNQLDGVGGKPVSGTELFFPFAQLDRNGKTFYFLTNTDAISPARLSFYLMDPSGTQIKTASLHLPPGASHLGSLPSLLAVDLLSNGHYLRMTSDVPVQGVQLIANSQSYTSAGAQAVAPAQKLWIPHYIVGREGEDTELRLINPRPEHVQATFTIHSDQGLVRGSGTVTVPGQGLKLVRLSEILGIAAIPAEERFLTGYVVVDVNSSASVSGTLLGTATFTGTRGKTASTLPMWREPLVETLYLQVAQSMAEALFTGLTVMNPNSGPATVTVRAWTRNGQPSGEKTVSLQPGQRLVDLLNGSTWFGPGFEQVGGHLKVSSNVPVVSFVVFGDSAGEFLAAVEGQPSED